MAVCATATCVNRKMRGSNRVRTAQPNVRRAVRVHQQTVAVRCRKQTRNRRMRVYSVCRTCSAVVQVWRRGGVQTAVRIGRECVVVTERGKIKQTGTAGA